MDGPISLADARLHLRVDSQDEDDNISRLIRVAARQIETVYGVVSVQKHFSFSFDCFAPEMRIPLIPVSPESISISYLDGSGEAQTFEQFRSFTRYDWTWLTPNVGQRWPSTARVAGAITVTAIVGFVDPAAEESDQQASVPADLEEAARLMVGHLFMRGGGGMPDGMDDLVEHYRFRRL